MILVLRLIGDCKHGNRSHDCLLNWLLKKIKGCLLRRGGKLWLVTKGDGLKIYDFYNDKRITLFFLSWPIILSCEGVNDYCSWLCHFERILNSLN